MAWSSARCWTRRGDGTRRSSSARRLRCSKDSAPPPPTGALGAAPATMVRTDLTRSLLRTLAADGLATTGPAGPRLLPAPDLPAALDIWRQVLLEQPALAPDLAWLALAAERLPDALAGGRLVPTDPADDAVACGPPPASASGSRR